MAPEYTVSPEDWWRQATIYQIYPRSFADANGDGMGDLKGITSRVPYLKELGVDAVWLSPFYPSQLADGGYDVDDYRDVDPRIGTLDDFAEMSAALHEAGIKLVVDIVPNHSSDQHRWFKEAVAAGRGSKERERYIFRDGLGPNGDEPPSHWPAAFGGIMWDRVTEPDGTPGQWYFHIFTKEQPDWNWNHPDVHKEFTDTLAFWSDRGVDGFRIDVAHALTKNLDPAFDAIRDIGAVVPFFEDGQHPLYDRDEVHEIYREWREVFNQYDPPRFAVAEAWVAAHRRAPYASTDGLGQCFNFDLVKAEFDADQFRAIVSKNVAEAEEHGSSSTWVLSNHDVVRHATRYGIDDDAVIARQASRIVRNDDNNNISTLTDGAIVTTRNQADIDGINWLLSGGSQEDVAVDAGIRRARAATLFILGLPGSTYIYQGEELGLHEVGDIPAEGRQDPTFFRSDGGEIGRDGCRVPIPWSRSGASFGFGDSAPHMPQPVWFGDYSVEAEDGDPASTLAVYREALRVRRDIQAPEHMEWVDSPADVLHFVRPNGWHVVTNFGTELVELPEGEVLAVSTPLVDGKLAGEATAWVKN